MGPGGFFPTNPDLADILGDTDFDFENSIFGYCWIPNFQISRFQNSGLPDFQISGFPDSQISTWPAGRGRGTALRHLRGSSATESAVDRCVVVNHHQTSVGTERQHRNRE